MVNHEYADESLMFPAGGYTSTDIKQISMADHGLSVVAIRRGRAQQFVP